LPTASLRCGIALNQHVKPPD